MASPPSSTETDRPHFKPTVSLYDWWLVKSQDNHGNNRLAVAGVSSAPQERVFYSAPICKKHDVFTLETTDGVIISLNGTFNKQQAIASGFPDEVAMHFQLGFYTGWEKGVAELLEQDFDTTGVSGRISDSGSEGPTSVRFSQEETRTPYEHVGSTYFQWIGRSKNLEVNQKNPMSVCSMKHKSAKLLPSLDAFENVGEALGAAVQSGGGNSEAKRCLSNYIHRVSRFLSEFWSKWMNQQMVGNGLNSENKTTDSVLTVSKTVNNSLQTDECEVGEKGVESSCLTSLHLSLEEGSHEQVSCEEMCDSEFPEQLSSRQSLNNSPNDMVNHAVEEETDTEDFISTALQSIGIPRTLEENEKNPEYGCSIKLSSTSFSASVDVGVVASGVTIPLAGEINVSKTCPRNPGGRVSGDLSIITRSKGETKQIVGNGLNSEQNTVDSVPAVESVSTTSQSVDYEVGGRQMFESFLSCCQRAEGLINSSPTFVHFARETPNEKVHCEDRLDVEGPKQITTNLSSDSTIDDSKVDDLMNHAAEVNMENIGLTEFQSFGRPQTREENETATEALEVQEEVNSKKEVSLSALKANTKKKHVSASLEGSKKRTSTPSTLEVNNKEKVSLSTTKVNTKKRKASPSTSKVSKKNKLSPSTLEVNKKRTSTPLTLEVNNKEKVSLSTTKVNTKKRKASPSTSEVSKKNKLSPSILELYSIISPESLSTGRSRSGRLLLRPLEFWRNQSPVYDKDHGVIGIQEEVPRVTRSRGSLSKPRKRKGNGDLHKFAGRHRKFRGLLYDESSEHIAPLFRGCSQHREIYFCKSNNRTAHFQKRRKRKEE
ncbi:hypothetical protein ACLB2K_055842 [Fragaria x ananassa]